MALLNAQISANSVSVALPGKIRASRVLFGDYIKFNLVFLPLVLAFYALLTLSESGSAGKVSHDAMLFIMIFALNGVFIGGHWHSAKQCCLNVRLIITTHQIFLGRWYWPTHMLTKVSYIPETKRSSLGLRFENEGLKFEFLYNGREHTDYWLRYLSQEEASELLSLINNFKVRHAAEITQAATRTLVPTSQELLPPSTAVLSVSFTEQGPCIRIPGSFNFYSFTKAPDIFLTLGDRHLNIQESEKKITVEWSDIQSFIIETKIVGSGKSSRYYWQFFVLDKSGQKTEIFAIGKWILDWNEFFWLNDILERYYRSETRV